MDKNLYWLQSLAAGKRGELLASYAITKQGYWVADVSSCYEYRQKDIDLVVEGTTIEVKNDLKSNYTDNIFVELQNNNNTKRGLKGWYYYCEADWMCFIQEYKGLLHFVKREELLKEAVRHQIKQSFDTMGYCVPLAAIQKLSSYNVLEVDTQC